MAKVKKAAGLRSSMQMTLWIVGGIIVLAGIGYFILQTGVSADAGKVVKVKAPAQAVLDKYDFNSDKMITVSDSNKIADYWKKGTVIEMVTVTSAGKDSKALGTFLGNLWKKGAKGVSITDITSTGKQMAPYIKDCYNYDFDGNGYVSSGDSDFLAQIWKKSVIVNKNDVASTTPLYTDGQISMQAATAAAMWSPQLGDFVGRYWKNGSKEIPMSDVVSSITQIKSCTR